MEIKDLRANQGKIDLVVHVIAKEQTRTFDKFGKQGKVCNAQVKDGSGQVTLTLWNEDIEKVEVGDKIHVQNGWCSEYRGEKQVSAGKMGKLEVVEKAAAPTLLTNDPAILSPPVQQEADEEMDVPEELLEE